MIDIRKWNESAQSTQPQPNSTSCEQDKNERLCFWQKKTRLCRQRGSLSPCDSLNLPKTNRSQLPGGPPHRTDRFGGFERNTFAFSNFHLPYRTDRFGRGGDHSGARRLLEPLKLLLFTL